MKKLKHTPGPWTHIKGHIGSSLADFVSCNKKTMDGMHIHNGEEYRGLSTFESEANARLIAAAPEMLEALIDRCILDNEAGIMHCKSRHAIEKATGQNIKDLLK